MQRFITIIAIILQDTWDTRTNVRIVIIGAGHILHGQGAAYRLLEHQLIAAEENVSIEVISLEKEHLASGL